MLDIAAPRAEQSKSSQIGWYKHLGLGLDNNVLFLLSS